MKAAMLPDTFYARRGKRALDLVLTIPALIALAPAFFAVAILVRCLLGSPVLFRQPRTGAGARTFNVLKFRTMTDARDESGCLLPDVARLPVLGRLLRRTSLDELPQLFNVLRGEMSLIGPRPLLARYEPYFTGEERVRFCVKPGISGRAQVAGRNDLSWEDRIECDVEYVRTLSVRNDFRIALKTLGVIVSPKGTGADVECQMMPFDDYRRQQMEPRS